jgi:hypothetical protein
MEAEYGTVEAEQRANEMVDPAMVESEHAPNEQFLANFGHDKNNRTRAHRPALT